MSPMGKSGEIGGDSWRSGGGGGGNLPNSNQNNNNNNSNNSSLSNVGGGGGNITDSAVGGPLAVMSAEQYRTLNRKTPFSSSWGDLFR